MTNDEAGQRYGAVAQGLHWLVAALIIVQFTLAWSADDLPLGARKLALLAWHKSVGMTVLMLAVLRLLWRLTHAAPSLPGTMSSLERSLARAAHVVLYALIFAMPLTGWLMSSAKNYSVSWFKLFTFPNLIAPNETAFDVLRNVHDSLSVVLLIVASLHVLAALKHHFWDHDDVLKRMLPALLLVLLAQGPGSAQAQTPAAPAPTAPAHYTCEPRGSRLEFTGTQAGAPFKASFRTFSARIDFAPEALERSHFDVLITLASVDSKDKDRDDTMRGPDVFDAAQWPTAHYVTRSITRTASGFAASGSLTLHGVTRDVPIEFTFQGNGPGARLAGGARLKRLDFGVGRGDWKKTDWVADEVSVSFDLALVPAR